MSRTPYPASRPYGRHRTQRRRKSTVTPGKRIPVETRQYRTVGADRGGTARARFGRALRTHYDNQLGPRSKSTYDATVRTLPASEREHRRALHKEVRRRQSANAKRKATARRRSASKRRRR